MRFFRRTPKPPEPQREAPPPLAEVPLGADGLPDVDALVRHFGATADLRARTRPSFKFLSGGDGSSRLGGTPDLPPRADWPVDASGVPLTFFAQVRVGGSPPLPDGTLQFFWDEAYHGPEDGLAWTRVLHHAPGTALERRATPDAIRAAEVDGFPREAEYAELSVRAVPWLSVDPSVLDGIELDAAFDALAEVVAAVGHGHRLLGYAFPVQGPPEDEAVAYWEGAGRAALLLQLDWQPPFDDAAALGDAGAVYFLLPEGDLGAARFDRCVAIMQCH